MDNQLNFTIIPEPKVIMKNESSGLAISLKSGISSLDIAKIIYRDGFITAKDYGFVITVTTPDDIMKGTGVIYQRDLLMKEGYILVIGESEVTIGAYTERGKFYAVQTLAQILFSCKNGFVPGMTIIDWPQIEKRCCNICFIMADVHLPFLSPNYQMTLRTIEEMAHYKMNAILIEFEAMFPYQENNLISSKIAFTREEIIGIRNACERNHLNIIPLVQCLGHVYFVLRHPEYAHLRECPETTQQYCPMNPKTLQHFKNLVDEHLELLGNIDYFHIGGDEARRLGQCNSCKSKMILEGMGSLYSDYVNEVGKYLLSKGIKPLVWGDIMEHHHDILNKLDKKIGIVYWNYDMVHWPRPYLMEMFTGNGNEIFGGSAVRFGVHTDYMFLYKKSMRGIAMMASECIRNAINGIIITNWSKTVPHEVTFIAMTYGAETSWGSFCSQKEFAERFSVLHFGKEISKMDEVFSLISESSLYASEITENGGTLPFHESFNSDMVDKLDRFDLSAPSFNLAMIEGNKQEKRKEVEKKLNKTIERGELAEKILNEHIESIHVNKNFYNLLILAIQEMILKSKVGLALIYSVRLLKYPLQNESEIRKEHAKQLNSLIIEWKCLRGKAIELIHPNTYKEILDTAIDSKFNPEVQRYLSNFSELLETDKNLQGLLNFKTY